MALFSARKANLFVGPQGPQGNDGVAGPPGPPGPSGVPGGVGLYSARPAPGNAGKQYFTTDGHTPFIDDGSVWRPLVQGVLGYQPPLAATFTAFNAAGNLNDSNGALDIQGVNDGSSIFTLHGYTHSLSTSTMFVECAMRSMPFGANSASTFTMFGILMRESATQKALVHWYGLNHTNGALFPESDVFTNDTTRASNLPYGFGDEGNGPLFLRIRRNGTSLFTEWSRNRVNWNVLDSTTVGAVFTTAPDQVGIVTAGANVTPKAIVLSYLDGSL